MKRITALAGMIFLLLASGTAQAGYFSLNPNCAFNGKHPVPNDAFFDAFFDGMTVGASVGGTTGVFFITHAGTTFVLKFEPEADEGVLIARKIFAELHVPHDRLIKEVHEPAKIRKIFGKILAAKSAVPTRLDPAQAERANLLIQRLSNEFAVGGSPPQKVVITEFLTAPVQLQNLGDAIVPPNGSGQGAGAQAAFEKLKAGIDAVSAAENQKLLGYLYVLDSFLGNEDRLMKGNPNWGNIFVVQGANQDLCLYAIDNEAHAGAPKYLAALPGLNNIVGQPAGHDLHAQHPVTLKADDYLEQVVGSYVDAKFVGGPYFAITQSFNPPFHLINRGLPKRPLTTGHTPYPKPVGLRVRNSVVTAINSALVRLNTPPAGQSQPPWIEAKGTHSDLSKKVINNNDFAGSSLGVVLSEIRLTLHTQGGQQTYSKAIDWEQFDSQFDLGVFLAMRDLADEKIADKLYSFGQRQDYAELSMIGLKARHKYIKLFFETGRTHDEIITEILAKNNDLKKPASARPTFHFRNGRWQIKG